MAARLLDSWRDFDKGKVAFVCMATRLVAVYANYGAGRPPALTKVARGIGELQIRHSRAFVALRFTGACGRPLCTSADAPYPPVEGKVSDDGGTQMRHYGCRRCGPQ